MYSDVEQSLYRSNIDSNVPMTLMKCVPFGVCSILKSTNSCLCHFTFRRQFSCVVVSERCKLRLSHTRKFSVFPLVSCQWPSPDRVPRVVKPGVMWGEIHLTRRPCVSARIVCWRHPSPQSPKIDALSNISGKHEIFSFVKRRVVAALISSGVWGTDCCQYQGVSSTKAFSPGFAEEKESNLSTLSLRLNVGLELLI